MNTLYYNILYFPVIGPCSYFTPPVNWRQGVYKRPKKSLCKTYALLYTADNITFTRANPSSLLAPPHNYINFSRSYVTERNLLCSVNEDNNLELQSFISP